MYQINVTTVYSGEYGFYLAKLPAASTMRIWLNNALEFYINEAENQIKVNNERIDTGNYILSGTYFTNDA